MPDITLILVMFVADSMCTFLIIYDYCQRYTLERESG